LKFKPAKTQGQPVPVSILLPVFFRHPDAPPLAGDSIIVRDSSTVTSTKSTDSAKSDSAKASAAKPAVKTPAQKTTKRKMTR
jgi:hypothetical protein